MDMMEDRLTMAGGREALLKEIMSASFSALDYKLYLDTHPESKMALTKFKEYTNKSMALREKYEQMYGPLTAAANAKMDTWKWIEDPYPWERMN